MKRVFQSLILCSAAACSSTPANNTNDMGSTPDLTSAALPAQKLKQTNLTADVSGGAHVDAKLLNPWGLAFNPSGPAWVADNHAGVATVYDSTGTALPLTVTVAPASGAGMGAPTGQIFNGTAGNFMGDKFIFSTEDGTIAGWQSGTATTLRADKSAGGAIYKGLVALTKGAATRLYAADFHNGKVDVFDSSYASVALTNGFVDAQIPAGFAPFNVNAIDGQLYVAYAKQDGSAEDDVKGAGNGYVDIFDFDGKLVSRFASAGVLNSPWQVVKAPADFGALSGLILVGNFGDGAINAFDSTGTVKAKVTDASGAPLLIDGLWALVFGPDTAGQAHNQLFFTAGPAGESHGLYGRLELP